MESFVTQSKQDQLVERMRILAVREQDLVEKFVLELEAQLVDRDVTFELTPEATRWLGEKGYDPAFGARPMARLVEQQIKRPLADLIRGLKGFTRLSGRFAAGFARGASNRVPSSSACCLLADPDDSAPFMGHTPVNATSKPINAWCILFMEGQATGPLS